MEIKCLLDCFAIKPNVIFSERIKFTQSIVIKC